MTIVWKRAIFKTSVCNLGVLVVSHWLCFQKLNYNWNILKPLMQFVCVILFLCIGFTNYSYLGLFVPWTIRTMGGLFVPWAICTMDYSYVGLFIRWSFRTTDYSYYGLFVPSVKYSHNINSWCEKALTLQAVYQMQVDLGTRLVICMCSCGTLVIFSYNS